MAQTHRSARAYGFESRPGYANTCSVLSIGVTKSAATVREALRLLDIGESKKSVARTLGISRNAIRNWSLANPETLLAGRDSAESHDRALCGLIATLPRPQYAYLLGLYLGDGSIAAHRRNVYRLSITCCDQYSVIMERCEAVMSAVLPNKVGRLHRAGCTDVNSYSKHWPCLFPQHGPGMKHTRAIELVDWQHEIVGEHVREFLTGLIHSDGCRAINRVKSFAQPTHQDL